MLEASRTGSGYVAVVGGVNIDIGGMPCAKLIAKDSNPGHVTVSLGGVGRNIAHNLALLDIPVKLLTAFGDDMHALRIEASCAELGINIKDARKLPGEATSTYLFVNDEQGSLALAVSDMAICERIDQAYLAEKQAVLDGASLIIADANLPEESLHYLASHTAAPLFVDPVSATKAQKLAGCLGGIHTLKPNVVEAEALSGVAIHDRISLKKAAETLLKKGLQRVFISLGQSGIFAAERGRAAVYPSAAAKAVNATGAGDAFMAGLGYAWLNKLDLADTVAFAAAAGACAVESEETVNPDLSTAAVLGRIRR